MRAFAGRAERRQFYVDRARRHRAADAIVQGVGWRYGRGCCVGCLAEAYPAHETLAREFDAPVALLYLADGLHEAVSPDRSRDWPEALVATVPVGADLSGVPTILIRYLVEEVLAPLVGDAEVRDAVLGVAAALDGPTDAATAAYLRCADLSARRAPEAAGRPEGTGWDLSCLVVATAVPNDFRNPGPALSRLVGEVCYKAGCVAAGYRSRRPLRSEAELGVVRRASEVEAGRAADRLLAALAAAPVH